jgi:hypothetical protein
MAAEARVSLTIGYGRRAKKERGRARRKGIRSTPAERRAAGQEIQLVLDKRSAMGKTEEMLASLRRC